MPARKRKAPETPEVSGSRRSQRISSSSKKSRYFEDDSGRDSVPGDMVPTVRGKSSNSRRKSGGRRVKESSDDDEDTYEDDPEQEEASQPEEKGSDEEESDEDAPPKVTVIPLPKLRDTGGIEYEDDRLHVNTLHFLKDLKANNKRPWLKCKIPGSAIGHTIGEWP